MASINEINDAVSQLGELGALFQSNPMEARRFEVIDSTLTVCARYIHLMNKFAACPPKGTINDYDIMRRFHNETVGFILGSPREIRVESWMGIINDIYDVQMPGLLGNDGSITAKQFARLSGDNRVTAPSFGQSTVRKELLSYAPRDILRMWLLRTNGIDDMLASLTAMAKIHAAINRRS